MQVLLKAYFAGNIVLYHKFIGEIIFAYYFINKEKELFILICRKVTVVSVHRIRVCDEKVEIRPCVVMMSDCQMPSEVKTF